MLIQTITYKDFNGKERTDDLYFNLTEFEVVELQAVSPEGIQKELERAVEASNVAEILNWVKMLVRASYGIRSDDGRHFRKGEEITRDFFNSAVYGPFMLSLFQNNAKKAVEFVNELLNVELVESALAQLVGNNPDSLAPSARELYEQHQRAKNVPAPQVVPSPEPEVVHQEAAPITPDFAAAPTEVPQTRAEARNVSGFSESEIAAARDADYQAWLAEQRRAQQGQ